MEVTTTTIRHKRKEVDILSKPCICIDVSKNTSHVQGFINSIKTPVSKPFKIEHTITGFNKIRDLYNKLVESTNLKPLVIFEYTGVYHKSLIQFLELENTIITQFLRLNQLNIAIQKLETPKLIKETVKT